MPRIPTSLLRKAYSIDALLPALLGPCRDLRAAQNELRWLREHVENIARVRRAKGDIPAKGAILRDLVQQRASGKPLQYILGTEYFGDVEIRCRPGVLIPRQDTAAAVSHLVRLICHAPNLPAELRVLDLCTGTGCIPLLFRHDLYAARDDISLVTLGVDISDKALSLAVDNLKRLRTATAWANKGAAGYLQADMLLDPFDDPHKGPLPFQNALNWQRLPHLWDILISNPPYISPVDYWKTTARSVRGFEPKTALVPPPRSARTDTEQADAFYGPLLYTAQFVEAKIVLLEVADLDQAVRVAQASRAMSFFDGIEIWREQPDQNLQSSQDGFSVIGHGNARSVFCWRGVGADWLGRSKPTEAGTETSIDAHERRLSPWFEFSDFYTYEKPAHRTHDPQGPITPTDTSRYSHQDDIRTRELRNKSSRKRRPC